MIEFKKHSGIYTLKSVQTLDAPLNQVWDFFCSPENLQKITPDHMDFKITSVVDKSIYTGQIISYQVGILPGIKQNWITEITQVKDQHRFIDEQRFGPYKMWHHEHWFKDLENGRTLMSDKISYKMPYGFLGAIAQNLFIKKQLTSIFEHRFLIIEKLFNEA